MLKNVCLKLKMMFYSSLFTTYTCAQAAQELKVSEEEIVRLVREKKLNCLRLGEIHWFTKDHLMHSLHTAGARTPVSGGMRRKVLLWGLLGICITVTVAHAASWGSVPRATTGFPLFSRMNWDLPLVTPIFLNSKLLHTRRLQADQDLTPTKGKTFQLESLVMEADKTSVPDYKIFTRPLYIQLTTNQDYGNGVGAYIRLKTNGNGWATGYHTEVYQSGAGTNIGYNAEMHKMSSTHSRSIGFNIQAKYDGSSELIDQAINIQSAQGSGFNSGIQFDGSKTNTGINFNAASSGAKAISIQGNYKVGLDVANNPIRMNAGTPIQLDGTGQITLSYNPKLLRIEFKNGDQVLGYLATGVSSENSMN